MSPERLTFSEESPEGGGEIYFPDNVDLHIRFSPHHTRVDAIGLAALIRQADIYISEVYGHAPFVETVLQAIADGDRSSYRQYLRSQQDNPMFGYIKAEAKALYRSGVRVAIADVPETDPRVAEDQDRQRAGAEAFQQLEPEDLATLVEAIDGIYRSIAEEDRWRDSRLAGNVGPAIAQARQSTPSLAAKARLRAVMELGPIHTPFYHRLVWAVQDIPTSSVSRSFSHKPYVFSCSGERIRRERFGLESTEQNSVAALTSDSIEIGYADYLNAYTDSTARQQEIVREVIGALPPEARWAVLESARTGTPNRLVSEMVDTVVRAALVEQGLWRRRWWRGNLDQ